jgi:hypothetical protein
MQSLECFFCRVPFQNVERSLWTVNVLKPSVRFGMRVAHWHIVFDIYHAFGGSDNMVHNAADDILFAVV